MRLVGDPLRTFACNMGGFELALLFGAVNSAGRARVAICGRDASAKHRHSGRRAQGCVVCHMQGLNSLLALPLANAPRHQAGLGRHLLRQATASYWTMPPQVVSAARHKLLPMAQTRPWRQGQAAAAATGPRPLALRMLSCLPASSPPFLCHAARCPEYKRGRLMG